MNARKVLIIGGLIAFFTVWGVAVLTVIVIAAHFIAKFW